MRNLKRALSLLLSSTMVLGMVVMGGSAAGYQDVDASNDNQEAIEVLQAVGIMSGVDDKGNFNPDGSLTRNEMAVVMAHLLNLDYDYYRGVNTFTDVPDWAAPYVAACVAEGVTAGIGNGLYGGDQKITAAQAGLMVMKALGYFQNQEDFGSDWQVATIRQASYINLFDKVNSNAETALTRGQVAQLVLNGLKAKMVDFTGDKGIQIGDVTVGYKAEYTARTNAAVKYNSIDDGTTTILADNGQYFVQLGEELYDGKLKLTNGSDDFERPSRVWSYDGQEIGTYAKKELIVGTYTKGVTGKEMYELLTAATIKEYDIYSYVDGGKGSIVEANLTRANQNNLSDTGKGVLTEVYVDNNAKAITFVSVNTWLAQATSDYNASSELTTLKIFDSYDKDKMVTNTTQSVDAEDVPAVANLKKDDFVLVNQSIKERTKLQVVAISNPEILQDCTVTAFSKSKEDQSSSFGADAKGLYESVTTGGQKYDGAKMANYDASVLNEYDADLLKDNSYNVYLDQYGYLIGLDLFEGTKNYVFITGYNRSVDSNISIETSQAAAIFLDGTIKPITVNVKDTNKNIQAVYNNTDYAPYFENTDPDEGNGLWVQGGEPNENKWYTYTVDDAGVYTLKPVKQQSATAVADIPGSVTANGVTTGTIDCSRVYLPDTYRSTTQDYSYGDDNSVYIVVSQDAVDTTNDKAITEVDGVYTGVQDVKIEIDSSKINSDAATDLGATPSKTYHVDPIYTVYDGDGYVIASIVLGEAQGATKNYAYILSGATSEKVENGVTYWNFDAIMGGKKVQLTIEDKFGNTVQNLVPYSVQELMFTGDYVTKIENISDEVNCALQRIDAGNDDVYDVVFDNNYHGIDTNKVDYASTNLKAVNAGTLGTDNTTISLGVRTLYTTLMTGATPHPGDQDQPVGLTFVKDAPAVVIQQENGKKVTNEYASVEEALGAMADADTSAAGRQFRGRIVAALNDMGVAEWVVFISATPVTSGTIVPPSPSGYNPTATINGLNINVKANTNIGDAAAVRATALQKLYDEGYSVLSVSTIGTPGGTAPSTYLEFVVSKNNQISIMQTVLTPVSRITVNGVADWYEEDTVISNAAAATYAVYSQAKTLPLGDTSGAPDSTYRTATGTGNVTVDYATHNNRYIYTDLYRVAISGAGWKWYQDGARITGLKGSVYNTVDTGNTASQPVTAIPSNGIVVSSALSNKTIYPFWTVAVTGETTQYVKNGQDSAAFSSLATSSTYKTTDGKYVSTDGSRNITAVGHDINITNTATTYTKVTLGTVASGAVDTTLTWTVNGVAASGTVYLKAGDVVVATATTGSTGETGGASASKLDGGSGATPKIITAYTTTGSAPSETSTYVDFGASTPSVKNGVSTFTWNYTSGTPTVSWVATP